MKVGFYYDGRVRNVFDLVRVNVYVNNFACLSIYGSRYLTYTQIKPSSFYGDMPLERTERAITLKHPKVGI